MMSVRSVVLINALAPVSIWMAETPAFRPPLEHPVSQSIALHIGRADAIQDITSGSGLWADPQMKI